MNDYANEAEYRMAIKRLALEVIKPVTTVESCLVLKLILMTMVAMVPAAQPPVEE